MGVSPTTKVPIEFTQLDTQDLALEIRQLRRLQIPLNPIERVQAMNSLRAFAGEWSIKFPEFDLEDYMSSVERFESTKGKILALMKKELKEKSDRDAKNFSAVFAGGFNFDSVGMPQ